MAVKARAEARAEARAAERRASDVMEAWCSVANAFSLAVQGSWVRRHGGSLLQPPASDKLCEAPCEELMRDFLGCVSPFGVRPSQPWSDFFGEFRAPSTAARRVPSNLERYAGNYVNVVLAAAAIPAIALRPAAVLTVCAMQVVALMAPPEVFDVHMWRPKSRGGVTDIGGAKLRLRLALSTHMCLLALLFVAVEARLCALFGVALSLAHAFFRTRPWTEVAKEKMKSGIKKVM